MSSSKSIIVKKIKKHGGGGHHGGAWKVAYADFVTAMMAFFLLMWLLNMSSDEKRVRLSQYFKHFSIYTEGGTSFLGKSSEIFNESGETSSKVFRNPKGRDSINNETEADKVETGIAGELGGEADHVIVEATEEGIRIQVIDREGNPMFEQGKNRLTPKGKEVLSVIGHNIKNMPNTVALEGHTDSAPFSTKDYSNWELSTERALSARRELLNAGLDPKRIAKVAGFADRSPLNKEDPNAPSNRRISIILQILPPAEIEKKELMPPKYSLDNPAGENIKLSTLIPEAQTLPKADGENPDVEKNKMPSNKSKNQPVINKEWIPVIDDSKQQPVIDKGWTPVVKKQDGTHLDEKSDSTPDIKGNAKKEIIIEKARDLDKLPSIKLYGTPDAPNADNNNLSIIKDLVNPVISEGGLIQGKEKK